jgi:hypothetical protein
MGFPTSRAIRLPIVDLDSVQRWGQPVIDFGLSRPKMDVGYGQSLADRNVYLQIEISDAQHIQSHLRDRSASTADVCGRLEDWDDGVAAARSESRGTRTKLRFGMR